LQFPELYSSARDKNSTILHALPAQDMFSFFHLPLSTEAYAQLASLQSQLAYVTHESKDLLVLYLVYWFLLFTESIYTHERA